MSRLKKISEYVHNGDARNVAAKKNTIKLVIVKVFSVAISFALIPITIGYVSLSEYGVWIALISTISWLSLFDVGISNGLRNKLSAAYANNDKNLSQKLVSTAYAILILIFIPLMLFLLMANNLIDWSSLLNLKNDESINLKKIVSVLVVYFCFRFILTVVNSVLLATHNSARASYSGLFEQIGLLLLIFILTKTISGSLLNLSMAVLFSSVGTLIVFSIYIYKSVCKDIAPNFRKIDISLSRGLFSLGIKFFVIQIAGIIQFQTANIFILRYYGSEQVANYNIVLKYFSLMPTIMMIILTPFWSATTDAYTKKDYKWIKATTQKYNIIAIIIIIFGLIMLGLSEIFYRLWLGNSIIKIDFNISLGLFIFCALTVYGSVYSSVLNGLGELRIQFIACLISPFVFLVAAYAFKTNTSLGVVGIIIASILSNFNGYILGPWQCKRIFSRM